MIRLSVIILLFNVMLTGYSGKSPKDANSAIKPNNTHEKKLARNSAPSSKKNSPGADATSSTPKITFKRGVSYGSTDDVIVGRIASFAVDNQNRVFIADGSEINIKAFNPDGSYLTTFGRQGQGPREFSTISQVITTMAIGSNKLNVTDGTKGYEFFPTRVQVFSLKNLSFSYTMKLTARNKVDYQTMLKGYYPKQIWPLRNGRFLVAYHRSEHEYKDTQSFIQYVIQDSTAKIISDPILKQKDLTYLMYTYPGGISQTLHSFAFFGKSLLAISNDDQLFAARTEEFKIDVYDAGGKHIRTFQHPFNNKAFNKSEVLDRYERTNYMAKLDRYEGEHVALKMIRQADNLPETWPALESMFFDNENRLWVSTIIDDIEVYEWWVLKNTGEVITKFKWPRDEPIEAVKNGKLYTRETEEETGLQQIVRYDITME